MAEVIASGFQTGHIDTMDPPQSGPIITMVPNPDFTFPIRPRQAEPIRQQTSNSPTRRPASASMHIDIPRSDPAPAHRRAASTLPSFSFNATDTSGRTDDVDTPPRTPDEAVAITPGRRGHRRGGSEFVGGDSRFGVSNAVSASPTKSISVVEPPVFEPTTSRRGHSHRRSAAISSHDVAKLMQPSMEAQPRLSSSLPSTPLEHPADMDTNSSNTSLELDRSVSDPFGAPIAGAAVRPPSRPRVGFSDNVEFIPRPLSTISSETESSLSTIRGHSVNNSISSMLSLGSPSPPSTRSPRIQLSTTKEDEEDRKAESPSTRQKRVEREGQWLRRRSSDSLKRPVSESAVSHPKTTFVEPDAALRPRKRALSHALGFDRRKSEPNMGISSTAPSRLSTLSLQEPGTDDFHPEDGQEKRVFGPKSSARKIRDWAASKITKITKESDKPGAASSGVYWVQPAGPEVATEEIEAPSPATPVAETDLDAVFSSQEGDGDSPRPHTPAHPRFEMPSTTISQFSPLRYHDHNEVDTVLDLDAALGPFNTSSMSSYKQRKELHSSRLNRDFIGFGGHYQRRSESEPSSPPPYESMRDLTRPQSAMADVFEEDEEDAADIIPQFRPSSIRPGRESNFDAFLLSKANQGSQNGSNPMSASEEELNRQGGLEPEHQASEHQHGGLIRSDPLFESGRLSLFEETIPEELTPGGEVEIVEADEEPRASSQTKSSDSSDTPTILAAPTGALAVSEGQRSLMTPASYQASAFSSPALRPGSFDTNRLDTAASSIAEKRTISSCTTGELGHDLRISVDVPSLTSSRSTMISSVPGNNSRRDFSSAERTMSVTSNTVDSVDNERRRKRGSIQSLSQLVGSPFGAKSRGLSDTRPQTSSESDTIQAPKKEHRLKKLMFWKSKNNSNQKVHYGP